MQVLRPNLPITYNEAALICLYRRPQVKTFNSVSIHPPLSSDEELPSGSNSDNQKEESPTAEAEADSP